MRAKVVYNICIVGGGNAGKSLGRLLLNSGHRVSAVICRDRESADFAASFIGEGTLASFDDLGVASEADVLFLTVPDDVIEAVCKELVSKGLLRPKMAIIHCSGVLGLSVLQSVRSTGAFCGSIHPVRSFADPETAVSAFAGTYCGYTCDQEILGQVEGLISDMEGQGFEIDDKVKPLYHGATVFASNYLVVLAQMALRQLRFCGINDKEAIGCLLSLMQGTLHNLEHVGIDEALTGPIKRGDAGTVALHLEHVAQAGEDLDRLYRIMGIGALEMAKRDPTYRKVDEDKIRLLLQEKKT